MGGAGEGVASEDMMDIQYEMLHMFGAVMAGSKVSHIHRNLWHIGHSPNILKCTIMKWF